MADEPQGQAEEPTQFQVTPEFVVLWMTRRSGGYHGALPAVTPWRR